MAAFSVTFDYLCPFARIANEVVLRALAAGADHQVDFRAFSLSQVHLGEGEQPVWLAEQPPSPGGALWAWAPAPPPRTAAPPPPPPGGGAAPRLRSCRPGPRPAPPPARRWR